MLHRRPPKLADREYRGAVRIFFTMCSFNRNPFFEKCDVVELVHDQLLHTCAECDVEDIAHCYMPDHLHALFAGASESADLRRLATVFRQRSAYAVRPIVKGKLWQEGYFDRHLRTEESTFDVVSYIVANPVRAGLCRAPRDYPFVGSSRYSIDEISISVQWRPGGPLG